MNPYERFFRLLWIVLGMVVREEVTIQWVNDCLETMHSNPKVSKAEIGFPPKPRKSIDRPYQPDPDALICRSNRLKDQSGWRLSMLDQMLLPASEIPKPAPKKSMSP